MQKLTDKEEEVMQILWKLEKAFVKEMLEEFQDRKSTRLNSSHVKISYAVFCLKKIDVQIIFI